jgi:acyl carrier protein
MPDSIHESVRSHVIREFQRVAQDQQKSLSPLTDDLLLLESGLDSLCFAIIVARLEDELACDPFSTAESFPVTLGDFIRFYEDASK